jgi:hypothetical protein
MFFTHIFDRGWGFCLQNFHRQCGHLEHSEGIPDILAGIKADFKEAVGISMKNL